MHSNLSSAVKTIRLKVDGTNYTGSAATSDLTSEAVDTAGFDTVRFICGFGAITSTAVTSTKVQQCDTSGGSYADLLGTSQTVADDDDNQCTITEIVRPRERYLKHVVDRGTANAVVDFLLVELSNAAKMPTTDDTATVVGREIHVSPAEGTA
jgi:hypothetical protein